MLLILFTFELNAKVNNPVAKKGFLDLRGISHPEHFAVELNGEWEFYWEKMLRPHDFITGNIKPDYFGKVPSYWSDYPKESIKTEPLGYATYRLTVLLPVRHSREICCGDKT